MAIQRAFLLIADIGGYTRFMRVHRVNLAHAQDVVAKLLEAVIDAASPKLAVAKLEGDAAFFFAKIGSDADIAKLAPLVAKIRRAFLERQRRMEVDRICTCDGCVKAGDLKIKFVAHAGEVAIQKVKSFTELAGLDVIVVHRMLKNSVPCKDYVLMSDAVRPHAPDEIRAHTKTVTEELEGVGTAELHYVDFTLLPPEPPPTIARSFLRAFWEHIARNLRSVPYILGMKKACDGFRNFDTTPALPVETTPSVLPPSG